MKQIICTFLFAAICCNLLTDCKKKEDKQPTAGFRTDKSEYVEGETIQLFNESREADSFRWTMPDGQTSKTSNASFVIPIYSIERNLQFKLEAISKDGTKSDYVVKNIPVKAAKGQIVLYSGYTAMTATLYIDGTMNIGIVPGPSTVIPACGQAGFPTFAINTGTHYIVTMTNLNSTYTGTVLVQKDQCIKWRVF